MCILRALIFTSHLDVTRGYLTAAIGRHSADAEQQRSFAVMDVTAMVFSRLLTTFNGFILKACETHTGWV